MARIDSLSILDSVSGYDALAEKYGDVLDNIQKGTISQILKNRSLSGDPTTGTVEAKRFTNLSSKTYGTARAGGAGQKNTAKPVTVAIDVDKELIEEVEEKDVKLYGVDGYINKRIASHQKSMERELERAFFTEAKTSGTAHVFTATTIQEKAEELIQVVETVSNDYVDGVPRDMISITMNTTNYGSIRTYLDSIQNSNVDSGRAEFGMFHGVRIYSSVYLPANTDMIIMVDEAIAQPVLPTVMQPVKIQLSNAYSFGLFYSYGTDTVMDDLIFYVATAVSE